MPTPILICDATRLAVAVEKRMTELRSRQWDTLTNEEKIIREELSDLFIGACDFNPAIVCVR